MDGDSPHKTHVDSEEGNKTKMAKSCRAAFLEAHSAFSVNHLATEVANNHLPQLHELWRKEEETLIQTNLEQNSRC